MLVNPDFLAWIHTQVKSTKKEEKGRPMVTRTQKIAKGGADKAQKASLYEVEEKERDNDVEYLNERKSNLNFYA